MVVMVPAIAAFCFGAIIGSFLNVCIWRLPSGESLVYPASRCPHCKTRIRSRDNIPVISYLLLRGHCRACGHPISLRYPVVEVLTGVLLVLLVYRFDLSPALAVSGVFVAALIVVSFIDR